MPRGRPWPICHSNHYVPYNLSSELVVADFAKIKSAGVLVS